MSVVLSPESRARLVSELDGSSVDVLIVGGGVTGAGAALDAAARGLSVLLVEAVDLAHGSSSRSTKLIHGGLRYLEQLDLPLVREALAERGRMTTTLCPHLVRPLPFLFPLTHRLWERGYVGAGIALYDGLAAAGGDRLPRHRHLGRAAARRRFPDLRDDALVGAVEFWDAQVDDARHTLTVARTAAAHGARVLTGARVVGLTGLQPGRIVGAVIEHDGTRATMTAGVTVNAAGPWGAQVERLAGASSLTMRTSKGVHLVVPRDRIDGSVALITKTASSVLFVIPFGHNWLIGTTDTPWEESPDRPSVEPADVAYLLDEVNRRLTSDLTRDDIVGVFSGLRPLISDPRTSATTKLSREHLTSRPVPGLVTVAGGKYTTYRVMAADAIDAALAELGVRPIASPTAEVALHGAVGYEAARSDRNGWSRRLGVPPEQVDRLLGRYGSAVDELAAIVDERPELSGPLAGAAPYLEVEIVQAVRNEGARTLDDVLRRRTRIAFDSPGRGRACAARVADLVGAEFGWDPTRRRAEAAAWVEAVAAEQAAEGLSG